MTGYSHHYSYSPYAMQLAGEFVPQLLQFFGVCCSVLPKLVVNRTLSGPVSLISKLSFDQKFLALGEEIPPVVLVPEDLPYLYWRRCGSLLFLSGHAPRWGRTDFRFTGKVGKDLSLEEGYAAARLTALNLLQTVRQAVGTLDNVQQLVDVFGVVNSAPGFYDQSKVMNGFSDLVVSIFGEAGKHSRMAIGGAELPFNIAVEIKMIVEVK